jgi:hypothetical protein
MNLFRIIDKLMLLTFLPPLYIAFRYVRWYLRQKRESEEV